METKTVECRINIDNVIDNDRLLHLQSFAVISSAIFFVWLKDHSQSIAIVLSAWLTIALKKTIKRYCHWFLVRPQIGWKNGGKITIRYRFSLNKV